MDGQAERNRRHEPAVVGLAAMGRPPVAEKARLVRVGVEPQVLEPADAGAGGALGDIGLEVEHRMPRPAAGNEEALRRLSRRIESGDELGADLVGALGDAGTERGGDGVSFGAEPLHRGDRRLDHAAERALPAGMRGPDDPRLRVGEQDHAAIGPGDAERQPGRRGHDPVAARTRVGRPVFGDGDRVRGMDLVGHSQPVRRNAERRRHPGAVLGDRLGRVARAYAAVERGVHAHRHAARAGEEGVGYSRQGKRRGGDERGDAHPGLVAAGWNPGGAGRLRLATAIALNSAPISPLPLPTSRLRACFNSSPRSGVARSASALV